MSDDTKTPSMPQPFARKPVQWGRMPATTFHVGPVPVAPNPLDRIPDPPRRAAPKPAPAPAPSPIQGRSLAEGRAPTPTARQGGILSGSLIPQARPAPAVPAPNAATPTPNASADLTVRPLPAAEPITPKKVPAPEPARPVRVAETPPVVEAASVAPTLARMDRGTARSSRAPLLIGAAVALLLVVGGGLWFALKPSPAPTPVAATPTVESLAPVQPAAQAPVETPAPTPTPPSTAVAARPAPSVPAPSTSTRQVAASSPTTPALRPQASKPAPSQSNPTPAAPPPAATTTETPVVVVTPPAAAPTPARQTQTDPNAPIVTRPQPLD